MISEVPKTDDIPKNGRKSKTKVFLWAELQMDQESRWYSMFKRLDQNKNHPTVLGPSWQKKVGYPTSIH